MDFLNIVFLIDQIFNIKFISCPFAIKSFNHTNLFIKNNYNFNLVVT